MKTSLTLRIYSLTCAVFHTYARVLPSSLASADSSTSKSIGRDLDPPSQNLAGSCPASPSINKRWVTLGDGASYDTFTPVELALNTPPPAGDAISVGDNQPSTFTMNPTDNQPINWNNIFNGQNKVDQLISIPAGNMFWAIYQQIRVLRPRILLWITQKWTPWWQFWCYREQRMGDCWKIYYSWSSPL